MLWPLSTLRAECLFKPKEKVAFLGDSITAQGWSNAHGYVRLVVAGLQVNGVDITPLPAGIGGHKSDDMLARLERDVLAKRPDWVTISCGMNDVIHGAKGLPLDRYSANMTAIVERCQKAGIKVVLFTTSTAGAGDSAQSKQLGVYSDFLRGLAKEKQCVLIDLYPAFVGALRKTDTLHGLTGDGVHIDGRHDQAPEPAYSNTVMPRRITSSSNAVLFNRPSPRTETPTGGFSDANMATAVAAATAPLMMPVRSATPATSVRRAPAFEPRISTRTPPSPPSAWGGDIMGRRAVSRSRRLADMRALMRVADGKAR